MQARDEASAWFVGRFQTSLLNIKGDAIDTTCTFYAYESGNGIYPAQIFYRDADDFDTELCIEGRALFNNWVVKFQEQTVDTPGLPKWVTTIIAYDDDQSGLMYKSSLKQLGSAKPSGMYGHDDAILMAKLENVVASDASNKDAAREALEVVYRKGRAINIRVAKREGR